MMLLPCLFHRLAQDAGRRRLAFAVAPLYVELRRQLQQLGEHTCSSTFTGYPTTCAHTRGVQDSSASH
jgi:hypothetical protein